MEKDFNKQVFDTMPDSVWKGKMPALEKRGARTIVFRSLAYAAAALCIPFAAATIILSLKNRPQEPSVVEPIAQTEIVYRVAEAVQADVVLPDSTVVKLNSGSTLRLSPDFGTGTRTVTLDGEGLFDVHKDRKVPFIIKTAMDVEVKVTGTKFDISCYSNESTFGLTLMQGSVEVTTPKKEVIHMEPSDQVTIRKEFFNVTEKEVPEKAAEWTEGVLLFDNTSMKDAISRIERWYGVDIVPEDETIVKGSFSAEFHSEPLEDVLKLLCISSGMDYSMKDRTITLKSGRI